MQGNMLEIAEKVQEYNNYIREHRANVLKAWKQMQEKCKDEQVCYDDFWYHCVNETIKRHDLSKYSAAEFTQYRNHFYPCADEEVDEKAFNLAWKHHYENNDHHWEHWLNDGGSFREDIDPEYSTHSTVKQVNDYAKVYIGYIEMICDWTAMGYKFGDTALQYYEKNGDKIRILPDWKNAVEDILRKMTK